jgi:hypothetical protein
MTRRDDREYREYLREEQRRQPGCPASDLVLDERGRATGGRVDIATSDPAALAAVHQFLKFQIAEHKTGDPTTVRTR